MKTHLRVPLGVVDGKANAAHEPEVSAPDVADANADRISLSLEDFEEKAFGHLCAKKRPASKAAPKPKANAKAKAKAKAKPKAKAQANVGLGCPRCRGSCSGCGTCRREDYGGIRLHGKAAYEKHQKAQLKKKKKRK